MHAEHRYKWISIDAFFGFAFFASITAPIAIGHYVRSKHRLFAFYVSEYDLDRSVLGRGEAYIVTTIC